MTQASNVSLGVSNFNSSGVLSVAGGGTGSSTGYFPAGTALVFKQTAAPTGWTKVTTDNDAALRVVSGAASTGGTVGFTTAFASQAVSGTVGTSGSTTATGTVNGTTLSTAQIPSHSHIVRGVSTSDSIGISFASNTGGNVNLLPAAATINTNSYTGALYGWDTGGSGSHDHSFSGTAHNHTGGTFTGTAINLAVKYVDVIVATKN
jgi:hypothetical protein